MIASTHHLSIYLLSSIAYHLPASSIYLLASTVIYHPSSTSIYHLLSTSIYLSIIYKHPPSTASSLAYLSIYLFICLSQARSHRCIACSRRPSGPGSTSAAMQSVVPSTATATLGIPPMSHRIRSPIHLSTYLLYLSTYPRLWVVTNGEWEMQSLSFDRY